MPLSLWIFFNELLLEGIDKENLKEESSTELIQLQEMADMLADVLIKAKGQILAQQEAKRKQTIQDNGTKS